MAEPIRAEGVVVREAGAAPEVEQIVVQPPGPGEVRVRLLASGVCHTDLHAQQGHFGRSFPYLLGHEATGLVEAVGEGVDGLALGQTVMLSWRAACGRCDFCVAGKRSHCRKPVTAAPRMHTHDGRELGRVLGLGTFCSHTVIAAAQAVPLALDLPAEATCLIGCGVVTGVGAVLFAAKVAAGDDVAVFGCGAVGLSVVQGARLARAGRIIAVDKVANRLEAARRFGATEVVDATNEDAVARIHELTGRRGVDHAFEAIGLPQTLEQALAVCGLAGQCVLIGVPRPKAMMTLNMAKLFYGRVTLRSTFYGDCLPERDLPLLASWYQRGDLDLDAMVSERIGLGDVPSAFEKMRRGETLRSVITF